VRKLAESYSTNKIFVRLSTKETNKNKRRN